jgi:hypothetical protein
MRYDFLVDAYTTERIKVVAVWSAFRDDDLPRPPARVRPARAQRARTDGAPVDTGGMINHAPTIYAYADLEALLHGEAAGEAKAALPGAGEKAATERAD